MHIFDSVRFSEDIGMSLGGLGGALGAFSRHSRGVLRGRAAAAAATATAAAASQQQQQQQASSSKPAAAAAAALRGSYLVPQKCVQH